MGLSLPQGSATLAGKVGTAVALFRLSGPHSQGDVHDEYGRRISPAVAKSNENKGGFQLGCGVAKVGLLDDPKLTS